MGFAPVAVAGLGDAVSELLKQLAQRIAGGERITADRRLLRETAAEYIAALEHGYGKTLTGVAWDSPDFETLQRLTENVYHFSAAKNWHELHDLTAAMRDGDRLRSFEQFEDEAQRIIGKYNSQWLRTEYNQAVAAAQAGARWNDFSRNADAMPYLRYQCIMDGNTRPEHAALDGVIKRIDDTFWDEYMPPNGWGCRCEAVQLPGSKYDETPNSKIILPDVPDMFRVNFGKKGVAFPAGHAYFRRLPDGFAKEAKNMAHEEVRRVIANAEQYHKLKNDPDYKDVKFDWKTGGVKATHIGHINHNNEKSIFMGLNPTELENACQDELFGMGHSAIFCNESIQTVKGKNDTALDLLLDGKRMDIASVTKDMINYRNVLCSKNSQLHRFNHLPYVEEKADAVCLYFHNPDMFSEQKVMDGMERLKEMRYTDKKTGEEKSVKVAIKHVYCVVRGSDKLYRYDFDE